MPKFRAMRKHNSRGPTPVWHAVEAGNERTQRNALCGERPVRRSFWVDGGADDRVTCQGCRRTLLNVQPSRFNLAAQIATLGADSMLPDWKPRLPSVKITPQPR